MFNWFTTKPRPQAERPAPGDPFAHPEIAAMSHRELSDLPLTPPPASAQRRSAAHAAKPLSAVPC